MEVCALLYRAPDGFAPHWVDNLPDDVYHADRNTVSSSALRKILRSPALFEHDVLSEMANTETKAMAFGRIVHEALLKGDEFLARYVVEPSLEWWTAEYGHYNSKAHREAKAAWRLEQATAGRLLVTEEQKTRLRCMLESVVEHPDAMALLKGARAEVSGYYVDPQTGIACRIRPDALNDEIDAFVDFKTTTDCSIEAFAKTIQNYRYDFQLGMYSEGIREITGRAPKYSVIIAVESEAPYETAVYTADQAMMEVGVEDYHRALAELRLCIDAERFPRRVRAMQDIGLPFWALEKRG